MKMDSFVRNLRVLWRADSIMADIRLRHLLVQSGLNAFAALIAAFGILMLEIAAYFALVQFWNAIWAAATLGVINFVIAALLAVIAARRPAGRELALAMDVHKSAIEALQADLEGAHAEIRAITSAFRHPLDGALLGLLAPLVGIVINTLRKPASAQRQD
jgi:hypothetical protein